MDFSDQALSTFPALMFVVFYFLKVYLAARPTPPVIYSDDGHEILDRTKPVKLGSDLKLYCTSQGGDPAPSISWRRGGVPVPAHGQDVDKQLYKQNKMDWTRKYLDLPSGTSPSQVLAQPSN